MLIRGINMGYIEVIFTERSDIFEVFYIDMFARKRILEEH